MRRTWRQLGVVGVTALVFGAVALGAAADILFIEDFENDINPDIWNAPNTWSVVDPGAVAGLGAGVLDITGGEVGLTNRSDFGDFVLEADFKAGPRLRDYLNHGAESADGLLVGDTARRSSYE